MTGLESLILRHRLEAAGFPVQQFHYHSVGESPDLVHQRLGEAIVELSGTRSVCLLGHSLGGLIALRLLRSRPSLPVVRTVLLGSPVNGSRAARAFEDLPGADWFFGGCARDELLDASARQWQGPGEVGVVAGTLGVGLGRFIGRLPEPHDGTVSLDETRLAGATDECVLEVSHLGMLVSTEVAARVARFFATGRFADEGQDPSS